MCKLISLLINSLQAKIILKLIIIIHIVLQQEMNIKYENEKNK